MPKSETGMPTNSRFAKGFTLIELLVVLVIFGITASVAVMAFGDFGKSQETLEKAERFQRTLRQIRYHAMLEGLPYKIEITPNTCQIFKFSPPNHWEKSHLQQKSLPIIAPQHQRILIQASGEITSFRLTFGLVKKSPRVLLYTDKQGTVHLKKLAAKDER